jgi:hypothetical protein
MTFQKIFDDLKDQANEKVDVLIKKNAYIEVIESLKKEGIALNEMTEEDFEILLVEEVEKQKNQGKGALLGVGALFLLGLLV